MNLLLLREADRVCGQTFVITDRRATHVRQVLRAEVGQCLRVGLLEGPLGTGRVEHIDEHAVRLECEFDPAPPAPSNVDLILAIARPKSLRKALMDVACMGVDRLVLLRTWRVEKPYLTSELLEPAGYEPVFFEGMMQGRTTRMPRVQVETCFKPFVEDRAEAFLEGTSVRLVAHPSGPKSISAVRIGPAERVALVVGPEGGLIDYELQAFARLGFGAVRMGPWPLRVEAACVALLAQVHLLRELLSPEP